MKKKKCININKRNLRRAKTLLSKKSNSQTKQKKKNFDTMKPTFIFQNDFLKRSEANLESTLKWRHT